MFKNIIIIIVCYLYDVKRFYLSSSINGVYKNKDTLIGHILRISHALEKGLALPSPRNGYGKQKINQLLSDTERFYDTYGWHKAVDIATSSMGALIEFHISTNDLDKDIYERFNLLKLKIYDGKAPPETAGLISINKAQLLKDIQIDPEAFFMNRHSIRKFSDEKVEISELKRAVKLAMKTPSVCNRQTCRVRIYNTLDSMKKVLSFQDGNKGFGHGASAILVVTSDMSNFYKAGERNQGYIDGGLFAMSLVYALHAMGLGTCMLNWSMGYRSDKRFRQATGIPDKELVIMMIAVGVMQDSVEVAASPRKDIDDFCIVEG